MTIHGLDDHEVRASLHQAWRLQAACRTNSTGAFLSTDPGTVAWCKEVCARCPVSEACYLEAKADIHNHPGIRGGLSEEERQRIASAHKRTARQRRREQEAPCGTPAGFKRHLLAHRDPCDACRKAYFADLFDTEAS